MDKPDVAAFRNFFPFTYTLSFDLLIDYWESEAKGDHPVLAPVANSILEELKAAPHFRGPITDVSILDDHKALVDKLMCGMFSHTFWDTDRKGVMAPFSDNCFYETPRFTEIMQTSFRQLATYSDEEIMALGRYKLSNAFFLILAEFYGVPYLGERHMQHHITDEDTGFDQHFAIKINPEFMEVRLKGELPELSQEEIDALILDLENVELWAEKLPPELFEFYGMAAVEMIDNTEDQLFSNIKEDLLEKNALFNAERFIKLEHQFKNLLGSPDIHMHIGAFNQEAGVFLKFRRDYGTQILMADDESLMPFANHFLEEGGFDRLKPRIVSDLSKIHVPAEMQAVFDRDNIKSLLYIPLILEEEMLGVVLIKSPHVRDLTPESWLKMERYVPIMATVARRSSELFNDRLLDVIKENFTSLHAATEWKFYEVALNYIRQKDIDGDAATLEPVVFQEVYPLYGASDIRSSSTMRNEAIRADLLEQLHLAKQTLETILERKPFPIYHELSFELDGVIQSLSEQLHSQDEEHVLHMLHDKIEPVFHLMSETVRDLGPVVENYFEPLDEKLGILYKRRKAFEISVDQLNRSLVAIIEQEEVRSQAAYPFYFENFKTDGVDYNIYIGDSLSRDIKFDPIYLRNLRLWQMLLTCKVALEGNRLKTELPVALELSHLILAHSTPLDIRFREDENRFDVDGAYNIRYEIMKKRIDKALVKGGEERITQPGKLAVIYSSDDVYEEYQRYFRYLKHLQLTEGEVEELAVEDLQGISGLKALRVTLNYGADPQIEQALHKELAEIGEVSLPNR